MNVLFICSRNQWRSPTAEQVFRRYPGLSVRSAAIPALASVPPAPAATPKKACRAGYFSGLTLSALWSRNIKIG
ncbi:hypothetical protein DXO15_16510 [Salmonella enterica]|nr:hypothetical protein [Salmonella enterica]ECT7662075.1 hypothetical protein [Salmonella enterica subsp. enterica serovar Agona]EAA9804948.1 hypothetical protein [Salmonella enterica]EAM1716904.1 hypothetical protein [Salmonella enterica]EAM3278239.1 hypothetical protein [Salmonella enterica]